MPGFTLGDAIGSSGASALFSAARSGGLSVSKDDDGNYNIKGLVSFDLGEHRGKKYDEAWAKGVIENHEAIMREDGYMPPVILGHNTVDGQEKEAFGHIKSISLVDRIKASGKKVKSLALDLVKIPPEIFKKLRGGRFPSRSVEAGYKSKRITALALLGGSTPYHKYAPMPFTEAVFSKDGIECETEACDWIVFEDNFPFGYNSDSFKELDETESEYRLRLMAPGKFKPDTFRRKEIAEGVSLVMAKMMGDDSGSMKTQAMRFAKSMFPKKADVHAWLSEHDISGLAMAHDSADDMLGRMNDAISEQLGMEYSCEDMLCGGDPAVILRHYCCGKMKLIRMDYSVGDDGSISIDKSSASGVELKYMPVQSDLSGHVFSERVFYRRISASEEERNKRMDELTKLHEDRADLRAKLAATETERDNFSERVTSMTTETESLRKENEEIKGRLGVVTAELGKASEKLGAFAEQEAVKERDGVLDAAQLAKKITKVDRDFYAGLWTESTKDSIRKRLEVLKPNSAFSDDATVASEGETGTPGSEGEITLDELTNLADERATKTGKKFSETLSELRAEYSGRITL